MSIDQVIDIRTMVVLLKNFLPSRKSINRNMINNIRLRTLKTRNEMEYLNITIEPCHFNTPFLTEYRDNSNNYSEGK